MTIQRSANISNPAAEIVNNLTGAISLLTLLQQVQSDKYFLPGVAAQLSDAMKLTQAEKDERDAAADAATQAKSDLDALQQQKSQILADIATATAQSDADIKAAKIASDLYVKQAQQTISDRWKDLDQRITDVGNREIACQEDEEQNAKDKAQNASGKAANDARAADLTAFATKLREIVPNAPVLEQSDTTG